MGSHPGKKTLSTHIVSKGEDHWVRVRLFLHGVSFHRSWNSRPATSRSYVKVSAPKTTLYVVFTLRLFDARSTILLSGDFGKAIRRSPRVALFYLEPSGGDGGPTEYVTVIGEARLVDDPTEKSRRYKEECKDFYIGDRQLSNSNELQ